MKRIMEIGIDNGVIKYYVSSPLYLESIEGRKSLCGILEYLINEIKRTGELLDSLNAISPEQKS